MQRAEQSIRVRAKAADVYRFWRNFENFPQFMEHVEEVRKLDADGKRTHWKLKGPMGMSVEYDAELTQDVENKSIGWNSTSGSMQTSGTVTFADVDEYTEVHVVMQWYDTPGGAIGEVVSKLFQKPDEMLQDDLERFKNLVETRSGAAAH
ncbi:MAG TPA: SRPBCC family protein [Chloroflexota bacterium]|nr:SRPBCC family protein [Chloroflexota bacterium]